MSKKGRCKRRQNLDKKALNNDAHLCGSKLQFCHRCRKICLPIWAIFSKKEWCVGLPSGKTKRIHKACPPKPTISKNPPHTLKNRSNHTYLPWMANHPDTRTLQISSYGSNMRDVQMAINVCQEKEAIMHNHYCLMSTSKQPNQPSYQRCSPYPLMA